MNIPNNANQKRLQALQIMPKYLYSLILLILLTPLILPRTTFAAPGMLSVTPSLAQVDLASDKPETVFYYKNTLSVPIELSFMAQDFSELEDSGQLQLLTPQDAKNYHYSLSSWLSFDKQELVLNPNEQGTVTVYIDANKLTSGGHYAAILAQVKQDADKKQVEVKEILSSLLFVRAHTGHEQEVASISTLAFPQTLFSFPATAVLRLQNQGNVDLTPHGLLEIRDPLHNLVAKGILNEGSLKILPESIRRFDSTLTTLSPVFLPGEYTAHLTVQYGKTNKTLQTSVTFFSIGSPVWYAVFGLLIVALVLVLLKRRKRHTTARAPKP